MKPCHEFFIKAIILQSTCFQIIQLRNDGEYNKFIDVTRTLITLFIQPLLFYLKKLREISAPFENHTVMRL